MPATIGDIVRTRPDLVTTTPDRPLYQADELRTWGVKILIRIKRLLESPAREALASTAMAVVNT